MHEEEQAVLFGVFPGGTVTGVGNWDAVIIGKKFKPNVSAEMPEKGCQIGFNDFRVVGINHTISPEAVRPAVHGCQTGLVAGVW